MNGEKLPLAMGTLAAMAALTGCSGKKAERPNIIFFLVDDYGWVDSGVQYGDELYPRQRMFHTPAMERLSERACIMSNGYACSLSTPTRTSLMTGMNSAHTRITTYTAPVKDTPTDAAGGTIGFVNDNEGDIFARSDWNWNGIATEEGTEHSVVITPMVRLLRDAGYYTIHVGKAHWGPSGTTGCNPYNMGFLVNVAGSCNGFPKSYYGEENYANNAEQWTHNAVQGLAQYYGTDTFLTEALTLEAKKALEQPIKTGQPFYLYMSHYAVHTPISADKRFYQKYIDEGCDEGEARYASMVEGVDKSLGDLMDFLEEKGVADNTVIIFMSDNGGHSIDARKGGVPHTQNAPLREGKASVYEGGIRVPWMFYWPGKTLKGRCDVPAMPEDMFPTILDIAGVKDYKTIQSIDGEDLVPVITGKAGPGDSVGGTTWAERELVFHMPHQWRIEDREDVDFMTAIRRGPWKLVYRMHTGELELYNLEEDLSERNDVAAEHPELVRDLCSALSSKMREWDAVMPVDRRTSLPCPLPDELKMN